MTETKEGEEESWREGKLETIGTVKEDGSRRRRKEEIKEGKRIVGRKEMERKVDRRMRK